VERSLINKLIEEQKLGMTGVVDDTTATKIGKLLGVKAIISGSVLKLQNVLEINARIIDVETGSIKAAENVKSSAAIRLQDLVVQMSDKIIKNFPLQGYVVSKSEKKVAIDLGREAGAKAGMEFIVYKEGAVIRHPKTGEVLDVEQIETGRIVLRKILDKLSEGEIVQETEPGAIDYGQLVYSARFAAEESRAAQAAVQTTFGGKGWLQIDTDPPGARVRILNIGPRYRPGIELAPGDYNVEVSAPGYRTNTQWIPLSAGENKQFRVALEAEAAVASVPPPAPTPAPSPAQSPAIVSAPPPPAPVAAVASVSREASEYIGMLRSGSDEKIVYGSKKIVRSRSFEAAVLETASAVLLAGYQSNENDKLHVDAMSWLCNVLGAAGDGRYRGTLQTVADGAANRKLKKYASKNLAALK
jgi:hypothetical protein